MATSTTNLGLTKPSVNDAADIGVLNSNFDKIDTAVAGKANSWYGLGELGVYCSDCNNAQRNGWFCIDTNTANLPDSGVSGTLFVETRPSSYGVDVYQTIKSDVTVIRRYYSSWEATWQPWEWVNPPMTLGVEYRTTERWQGKPVYTMLVDIGLLPNASSKYTSGVLPAGIYVTSIIGSAFSGYNSVPIQSNGIYVSAQGEWGTLYISTTSDYSAFTGYVTVKYTK